MGLLHEDWLSRKCSSQIKEQHDRQLLSKNALIHRTDQQLFKVSHVTFIGLLFIASSNSNMEILPD